jgi:hypothetical protein
MYASHNLGDTDTGRTADSNPTVNERSCAATITGIYYNQKALTNGNEREDTKKIETKIDRFQKGVNAVVLDIVDA